jgi:flagellin-specific chaperone FliS
MNHPHYRTYPLQSQLQGWTRIDMLIALYDRAISTVRSLSDHASRSEQTPPDKFLDAQKCLLAIHAGLKPDESEVAFNVARLIHFVSGELIAFRYDSAIVILESLRNTFESIREEATRLELNGLIPSLENSQSLNTVA